MFLWKHANNPKLKINLGNQAVGERGNLYKEFFVTALETSHARHPGKCSTIREPARRTSLISAKTDKSM